MRVLLVIGLLLLAGCSPDPAGGIGAPAETTASRPSLTVQSSPTTAATTAQPPETTAATTAPTDDETDEGVVIAAGEVGDNLTVTTNSGTGTFTVTGVAKQAGITEVTIRITATAGFLSINPNSFYLKAQDLVVPGDINTANIDIGPVEAGSTVAGTIIFPTTDAVVLEWQTGTGEVITTVALP